MTSRQEIESQLAQYEGKLNAIERERARAWPTLSMGAER